MNESYFFFLKHPTAGLHVFQSCRSCALSVRLVVWFFIRGYHVTVPTLEKTIEKKSTNACLEGVIIGRAEVGYTGEERGVLWIFFLRFGGVYWSAERRKGVSLLWGSCFCRLF